MEKITYNGKEYMRNGMKWFDSSYVVVHQTLQDELNKLYIQSIDLTQMDVDAVVLEGDRYKQTRSFGLAIRCYEEAASRCDADTMSCILPRITSCYRGINAPERAIELFAFAKRRYGTGIMNPALLTSAAAAYCDMRQYDNARKCCKRAYAMCNGRASEELKSVFGRIKKECGEE